MFETTQGTDVHTWWQKFHDINNKMQLYMRNNLFLNMLL